MDRLRKGKDAMPNTETVVELFELAIASEWAAEELYLGFKTRFARHQDAADFWGHYAREEVGHARWLERIRDDSRPERLSALADPFILTSARSFLQFSPQHTLEEVKDLEDAFQAANDLENSEINVVFEFIIANFSSADEGRSFLRSQLREHIAILMVEFPARFSHPASRQAVKALE
jgi:rubrerythrin